MPVRGVGSWGPPAAAVVVGVSPPGWSWRPGRRVQSVGSKVVATVSATVCPRALPSVMAVGKWKPAATFCGGQQQMLALAAAYTREPSLVLVDEASLGLALIVVDAIFEFLQACRRWCSHRRRRSIRARALGMAAAAFLIRQGRIVYRGNAPTCSTRMCSASSSVKRAVGAALGTDDHAVRRPTWVAMDCGEVSVRAPSTPRLADAIRSIGGSPRRRPISVRFLGPAVDRGTCSSW